MSAIVFSAPPGLAIGGSFVGVINIVGKGVGVGVRVGVGDGVAVGEREGVIGALDGVGVTV